MSAEPKTTGWVALEADVPPARPQRGRGRPASREHGSAGRLPVSVARQPAPVFDARLHRSLDTLADAWQRLEQGGDALPCQRLDWTRLILAHLADQDASTPLFVELRDRLTHEPLMIVPLILTRRYGIRLIRWFRYDVCDYAAPVLAAGMAMSAETAAAAWSAVLKVLPPADIIHVSQIPSAVGRYQNPLALLPGVRPIALPAFGSAIEGDPDTVLQRLCRSSTYRDMGNQRRRLERAGTLRFSCAETAEDLQKLYAVMVEQRRQRFGELGRDDLLLRPDIERFYAAAAADGLATGAARLFGLFVDDVPIATFYALVHGGTIQGLILTMSSDEAWKKISPGVLVVADAIRWARSHGLEFFDLSIGDNRYKRKLGLEMRTLFEIVQSLTVRGWLAVNARQAFRAFREARRDLVARLPARWARKTGTVPAKGPGAEARHDG